MKKNPMAHKAQVQLLGFVRVAGIPGLVPNYAKVCSACGQPVRRIFGRGPQVLFWHTGGIQKGTKKGPKLPPHVRVAWPAGAELLVCVGDLLDAGQVIARLTVGDGWVDVLAPVAGTVVSTGDGRATVAADDIVGV